MSINQEKRRRALRDEVRKFVSSTVEFTQTPMETYNLVEFVAGLLLDQIADLQGRVEDLESMSLVGREAKG